MMGRRFLAPEVIQNSSIDCGPACLHAALQGFGIDVAYERLRYACQTDVDGTSINAVEAVANRFGLAAEQIWVPLDHFTIPEVTPLPAVVVVQSPSGVSHFILLWRRVGPLFQIMDPETGRRWVTASQLAAVIFEFEMQVDGTIWRKWAGDSEFGWLLRRRLNALDADEQLFSRAAHDLSAVSLASLDAVARFVDAVAEAGGLRRGPETRAIVSSLFDGAVAETHLSALQRTVPEDFYCASPVVGAPDQIVLRGTVLVRLRGARVEAPPPTSEGVLAANTVDDVHQIASLPWREVFSVLRRDGLLTPGLIAVAAVAATVLSSGEALLLRSFLDVGTRLQLVAQRLDACALLLLYLVLVSVLQLWNAKAVRSLGRRIELRLRADLFMRIPRLKDEYFRSRPPADMAHRSHFFHPVREIASVAARILCVCVELLVTVIGLLWLDPSGARVALLSALASVAIPLLGQRSLVERDFKVRALDGTLVQFYLDALMGLISIRAHGAERALRWEHGSVLLEWARACRQRLQVSISVELTQSLCTIGLSTLLVAHVVRPPWQSGTSLLFAYWALKLPWLGQELSSIGRELPRYRTLIVRLLEPLRAGVEGSLVATSATPEADAGPLSIVFDHVCVKSAGRAILEDIDVCIGRGEHVAIVGASGAGKSTLMALLIGLRESDEGQVLVDGRPLDGSRLAWLRQRVAWVDPSVSLWNRSLIDNVSYGAHSSDFAIESILQQSDLVDILERLPEGLQSELGENGRVLSGGEGQRVRLARAMTRASAGLAVLDEPFRGLELERRQRLLRCARALWRKATLVCVTHDLPATLDFDRVVVVEEGRVREHGTPAALLGRPDSRYAELLRRDDAVRHSVWNHPDWRRLRVELGVVKEEPGA